ncbi:MAG: hypothetical protein RLZZ264_377 [Bacillota bacterium]|jgi:hypothetical protein
MNNNTKPNPINLIFIIAIIIFILNVNFLFFEPRTYNFFWVYIFLIPRITPIISAIVLLSFKSKSRFFWASSLLFIQFLIELFYFQPWNVPDFDSLYILLQYIVFPIWFFGSIFFLSLTIKPERLIRFKPYLLNIAILLNILLFTLESINFIDFVNNGQATILEALHTIFFNVLPLTILRTGLYIPIAIAFQSKIIKK